MRRHRERRINRHSARVNDTNERTNEWMNSRMKGGSFSWVINSSKSAVHRWWLCYQNVKQSVISQMVTHHRTYIFKRVVRQYGRVLIKCPPVSPLLTFTSSLGRHLKRYSFRPRRRPTVCTHHKQSPSERWQNESKLVTSPPRASTSSLPVQNVNKYHVSRDRTAVQSRSPITPRYSRDCRASNCYMLFD